MKKVSSTGLVLDPLIQSYLSTSYHSSFDQEGDILVKNLRGYIGATIDVELGCKHGGILFGVGGIDFQPILCRLMLVQALEDRLNL